MPLEERHRVLGDLIKSERGKVAMDRRHRAGERYEAGRIRREVTATRGARAEQAERYLIEKRTPQPVPVPTYIQGTTGRSVRLTDRDLQEIKKGIGAVIDANDKTLSQGIRADRLALECKKREAILRQEEREVAIGNHPVTRFRENARAITTRRDTIRPGIDRANRDRGGIGD